VEVLLGALMGIGLAAACGFRVFVPMWVVSVGVLSGHVEVAPHMAWLGSPLALGALSVAMVLEVASYHVPWMDNLLDTLMTPAAVVAGVVLSSAFLVEVSPELRWTLSVVAGGGAAGAVQGLTVAARAVTGVTTGGLANPIVGFTEAVGSLVTSVLALVLPVVAVLGLVGGGVFAVGRLRAWRAR